jgi:hypothetical protein
MAKLRNGAVTGVKMDFSGVTVPSANHAASADTATSANHASRADTATNAKNAANASNAADLGGRPASAYALSASGGQVDQFVGGSGEPGFQNGSQTIVSLDGISFRSGD